MSILSDRWIREQAQENGMIEPFVEAQRREGCISYGLSSYGYDARVADEFKIFTNVDSATVDPKDFASNSFVDRQTDVCIIPPNSFALARTVEYFRAGDLSGQVDLCPVRNHRERDAARAGLGRPCDAGIFEHHATARQSVRQRGRLPVPVPARQ
jgi:deoxycytidine triphosphate deaminase